MIWGIISDIAAPLLPWIASALAGLAAVWAIRAGAKREARMETALEAAERIAAAEIKRGKIEDDIDQDTDLVRRAKSAGVVRPE